MSDLHTVYHLVTRNKMHVGQIIKFQNNEPNQLYRFFLERSHLTENGEHIHTMLKQNVTNGELHLNQDNTDLFFDYAGDTARAIRETITELVRLQHFPHYPSRLSCLYVSDSLDEAAEWKKVFDSYNRNVLQLVKLRVRGNYFKGDAQFLPNSQAIPFAQKIQQAHTYWQGARNGNLLEVLVDGEIEVMEILEEYKKQ